MFIVDDPYIEQYLSICIFIESEGKFAQATTKPSLAEPTNLCLGGVNYELKEWNFLVPFLHAKLR